MPTKIDLAYARQLIKNYKEQKLGKLLLPDDSQSVWFSKDMLLDALKLPPDTDTGNISGLRFYFGSYEEYNGYPQNPYDNNKLTLVMVATGDNNIDIDRGGTAEVAYGDIINEPDPTTKTKPAYPDPANPLPLNSPVYNEGQITPPPSNQALLGLNDY